MDIIGVKCNQLLYDLKVSTVPIYFKIRPRLEFRIFRNRKMRVCFEFEYKNKDLNLAVQEHYFHGGARRWQRGRGIRM